MGAGPCGAGAGVKQCVQMRLLLSLLLAIGLCACGGPANKGPFTNSRIPPGLPQRAWPPQGWAWGLIQSGASPPVRYGVAAPPVTPRGQILILPDYGEPAEAWFETAQGLIERRYAVWLLEAAGQGGSGRYAGPRDLGHAPDFEADVTAMKVMSTVMDHRPAVLVAQGAAAPVLLDALRRGLPARGVVLSTPLLTPVLKGPDPSDQAAAAALLAWLRLGPVRALGQGGWLALDPLPPGRAGVAQSWQAANPALRMGGPSWGWIAAFQQETRAVKAGSLAAIATPVLILQAGPRPSPDEAALCRRLPACTLQASSDSAGAWTGDVASFIDRLTPSGGQARRIQGG